MEVKGRLILKQIAGYRFFEWQRDDGSKIPLPPDFTLRETVALIVRLDSTRGGNAAWWRARGVAEECLNQSPYNPIFRGIISEFCYSYRRDAFIDLDDPNSDLVIQGGSQTINFYAKVLAPVPDPLREILERVKEVVGEGYRFVQGSLTIYPIFPYELGVELEEVCKLLRRTHPERPFYNHHIIGEALFGFRVIDRVAWGILKPNSRIWIVSPDHLEEPIFLHDTTDLYVFRHPLPSGRFVD